MNVFVLIVLSVLLSACGSPARPATAPQPDPQVQARALVTEMVEGRFEEAAARFSSTARVRFTPERLAQGWANIAGQAGTLQRMEEGRVESDSARHVVTLSALFERTTATIRIAFDGEGQVSGFQVTDQRAAAATPPAAAAPPAEARIPPYANTAAFQEREVVIGSGEWTLPGTLSMPQAAGPVPAVVLVHGSGPHDRDETIGPNKPFLDIAWGLASVGIAVLRYEKRTRAYPQVAALPNLTVQTEIIDDVLSAVAALRATPGIDPRRIYVLGHSQGGKLLPRIARQDAEIAGFVALAAPARPMDELIEEQVAYLGGGRGERTAAEQVRLSVINAQIARVRDPQLSPGAPASELLGFPGAYWLDLRGYQPATVAREITRPILILQGERDYQVTMKDFELWREALGSRPNVRLRSFARLNHLFMEGSGPSTPAEYARPGHVADEVIEEIVRWLRGYGNVSPRQPPAVRASPGPECRELSSGCHAI